VVRVEFRGASAAERSGARGDSIDQGSRPGSWLSVRFSGGSRPEDGTLIFYISPRRASVHGLAALLGDGNLALRSEIRRAGWFKAGQETATSDRAARFGARPWLRLDSNNRWGAHERVTVQRTGGA
jgi:hypothetical protein